MKVPYIGITGVINQAQIRVIGYSAINIMAGSGLKIMLGVLVSSKTLHGFRNKYPNLYPMMQDLPSIFLPDPRFLNLIHYNTDNPLLLRDELFQIIRLFKNKERTLKGFQLNVPWPAISHLEDLKNAFPKLEIVLQIGPKAFEQAEYSPKKAQKMAGDYLPFVDYFLLDNSSGFGRPLDAQFLLPYLLELSRYHSVGLAVAGGLGPDLLHLVEPLIKEFPDLSIDAQKGIQEKGALSVNKAVEYIRRAIKMYE